MELKTLDECKNFTPTEGEVNNVYSFDGYNLLLQKMKNLDYGEDNYSHLTKLVTFPLKNKKMYIGDKLITKFINNDKLYVQKKIDDFTTVFPPDNAKYAYIDTDIIVKGKLDINEDSYVKIMCGNETVDTINTKEEVMYLNNTPRNVGDQMFFSCDDYLVVHTHKKFENNKTYNVISNIVNFPVISFTTIERKPVGKVINVSKFSYDGDFQTLQSALEYLNDKTGEYIINIIGDWEIYHELISSKSKATITINGKDKWIKFDNCSTLNLQETERSLFECAGGDIIINQLNIHNTYSREKYRKYEETGE